MIADAALCRPASVVVLDAEAVENLGSAVVHPYRERDVQFTQRPAQQFVGRRVEVHDFGGLIQLLLCDGKRI